MKKISLVLVLFTFLIPSLAFAQVRTSGAVRRNTINEENADASCVKTAVETRETSLISAFSKFNTSMVSALNARKTALADAWSNESVAERKTDRKTAWSEFSSAKKSAAKTYRSEKKAAFTTFKKTVTETCKNSAAAKEEVENSSIDPTI